MKVCKTCKRELPVTEFYAMREMKDGHFSSCKDCTKARVKARREADLERIRTYDRQRGKLPHRIARVKIYAKDHPDILSRGKKAWIDRNLEKRAAHVALGIAVRSGKVVKPDACEKCGARGRIEAHHPDYSKPLEVMWLCRAHHLAKHGK